MVWFEHDEVCPSLFLLYRDDRLPGQLGVYVKEEGIWRAPLDAMHQEVVDILLRNNVPIVDKASLPPGRENPLDIYMRELETLNLSQDEWQQRMDVFCDELSVRRRREREEGKPRPFNVRRRDRASE